MPLFQCDECGCVENTALGNYWTRNRKSLNHEKDLGRALCSACTPNTFPDGSVNTRGGAWHNRFPRVYLPKGEWEMDNSTGNLKHKKTGETDYRPHIIRRDGPEILNTPLFD